ncbi:MAG: peptide-methionine (S)-S-oxide reductase MsrA [Clostridia bacterium]|nr:peptide-methionine (S)-S-oxide reductase MsrA [Clostridia bacterium]
MKTAYFAGGCFWCITPILKNTAGVLSVISGYSGGTEVTPSYEDVKAQKTGHRETISVDYDDKTVSFGELLDVFIGYVDPFDDGGQFIDRGRSYTLAVYYQNEEEKSITEHAIRALEERSGRKVYISIEPFLSFYPAEEYHQDYYKKHPAEFAEEMKKSGRS